MAGTGVGPGAKVGTHAGAEVLVQIVASASVALLAELRAELIVAGEVAIEDEPEEEEVDVGDRDESELSPTDEDDPVAWDSPSSLTSGEPKGEEGFSEHLFEIRVRSDEQGGFCEVPQSGWEGLVGRRAKGRAVLDAVAGRMACYRKMADWLTEGYYGVLPQGPTAFLTTYQKSFTELPMQKKFLAEHSWDIEPSSFSNYIAGGVLRWPNAAIPLRMLFKD